MKDFLNILINWLHKPIPFYETNRQKVVVAVAFGVFITGFLVLFNYSPEQGDVNIQLVKAFIYGILTLLVLCIFNFFFPFIIPTFFDTEKWNMGRSLVFGILIVLSIGLANSFFAFKYDNPNLRTELLPFTLAVIQRTFLISIIPTFIFNILLERRFYKKYYFQAMKVNNNIRLLNANLKNNRKLELGNNILCFEHELIYIKAEGNYCKVHYAEESKLKKVMIRNTLKNIETELTEFDNIVRCHKSYIINLNRVVKITGNAKGYSFIVDEFKYPVPVSRTISKHLLDLLTNRSS